MTQRTTIITLLGLLAVLVLWHQVFVMTGVLWWNAPDTGQRLPVFETLHLPPVDTHLVDLPAYLAAHPEWRPQ